MQEIQNRMQRMEMRVEQMFQALRKMQEYFKFNDQQVDLERKSLHEKQLRFVQNCQVLNEVINGNDQKLRKIKFQLDNLECRIQELKSAETETDFIRQAVEVNRQNCVELILKSKSQLLNLVQNRLSSAAHTNLAELKEEINEVKQVIMTYTQKTDKRLQAGLIRLESRLASAGI